ncbi:hypothetical protein NSQ20_11760 [Paenibacillus sp. FSL K6-1122]|uniref:hypothetical protein n=1 Tax=Paenibacillus sp. FSL K6-1122 TaxID=2954512 RepID=UPI0030EB2663
MTYESLYAALDINQKAIILKSNMKTILKTQDEIDEFYLRLKNDFSELNIHRELYKFRLEQQRNSSVIEIIYQEFQENPVKTLSDLFNETIVETHVKQMYKYKVNFGDMLEIRRKNKGIRFGDALSRLAIIG